MKLNRPRWIGLVFGIVLVLSILSSNVYSIELNPFADTKDFSKVITNDMSSFIKEDFNSKYGAITISKTVLWIKTDKIAEYTLTSTSESIIDLEMYGKATLYSDGTLFDGNSYRKLNGDATTLKDSNYFIQITKDNYVNVPDKYSKICSMEEVTKDKCKDIVETYKKINQPITTWEVYNGEILKAGNYNWKWIGKRNINQIIDVIPIKSNKEFSEWVWWDASWSWKKIIFINSTSIINNASVQINITWNSNMQTDFDDLRFVDSSETSELGYWFDNNTYIASNSVLVWINISSINPTTNKTIYMYYGNLTATTTSDISKAFLFGDDFNGASVDWINKWQSTNQALYTTSGGLLTISGTTTTSQVLCSQTFFGNNYTVQTRDKSNDVSAGNSLYHLPISSTPIYSQPYLDTNNNKFRYGFSTSTQLNGTAIANTYYRWIMLSTTTGSSVPITWFVNSDNGTQVSNETGGNSVIEGYYCYFAYIGTEIGTADWIFVRGSDGTTKEPTYTFGVEESSSALNIINSHPANNTNQSSSPVVFGCNATGLETNNITSVVLNATNGTMNWQQTIDSLNTKSYNATFTNLTLLDGNYKWNCLGYGDERNGTSAIWNLGIDTIFPIVNITYPLNGTEIITLTASTNVTLNFTASDLNLNTCWFYNGTGNNYLTCGTNSSIILLNGYHTITYFANDTAGNEKNISSTFFINYIQPTAIGYTTPVISGETTNFYFNISANNIIQSNATLDYNGTSYQMLFTIANSTNVYFYKTLTLPIISSSTSKTFNITYYVNGVAYNTSTYTQDIYTMNNNVLVSGTNCASGEIKLAYNFTFFDEDNQTMLSMDTIDYNFKYGLSNSTQTLKFGALPASTNLYLCYNSSISQTFNMGYSQINYQKIGWVARRWYGFTTAVLTNVTNNVSLYDLNNVNAQTFQLIIKGADGHKYINKYVSLIRWYPSLDTYTSADWGITDNSATTATYVRPTDTDYRVGVYEPNGSLIYLASPIRFICILAPCTYSLTVNPTLITYQNENSLQFTPITFNKLTNIWTFSYSDSSMLVQTINLSIYEDTGSEFFPICTNTVTGFAGAVTCNTSDYAGWNTTMTAYATRESPNHLAITDSTKTTLDGGVSNTFGLFLSILIFLPIVFVFAMVSPVGAIIGGVVGLIPAMILGSVPWGVFGAFAVICGIIMHFINKRVS